MPTRFPRLPRAALALALGATSPLPAQYQQDLEPPGRLVDIGGYRLHLWCLGTPVAGRPTVVLSAGGGDFASDWSLVQRPLADSVRVCSYDRPGYGWSDPGPGPRTFKQEAYELRTALERSGEHAPFVLVGHSLGALVVRLFAEAYRSEVAGIVLVGPANENGKLGFRGQFVLPRILATDRPIPAVHTMADSPPAPAVGPDADSCRARAQRTARITRPYDQLRAQAQRYRMWALLHPFCGPGGGDDYFAEQMALFYKEWEKSPNPLGNLPLVVVMGLQRPPPPGMSLAEWNSDSMRIDLSKLSKRGRLLTDSLSGHHVQLDNPDLVIRAILEVLRTAPD